MSGAVPWRVFVCGTSGVHNAANHHHARLSSLTVAARLPRASDLQCGLLDSAIPAPASLDCTIWLIGCEILDSVCRRADRCRRSGLVPSSLVLYPVLSVGR